MICDRFIRGHSRRLWRSLSQSSGHLVGGTGVASTARCAEAETATTGAESSRSVLLDHAAKCVAAMVRGPAIVKPATVIGWHRRGFLLYWRWRSRQRGGRPRITEEVRSLIRKMRRENADWGAPKIHGELLKLGFTISERTVARYLTCLPPRIGKCNQRWKAFLANHREVIVAFDFFTVPTLTFKLLYCFLIIEHGRRRVLHGNVTAYPTAEWVVQQ